jgi:probable rRNA maturation factor
MTVTTAGGTGMTSGIEVQRASDCPDAPAPALFTRWAGAALGKRASRTAIAVRIVAEEEGRALNLRYRSRDSATNVLSFPADIPPEICVELAMEPLGDLVLCAPVVEREAREQNKRPQDHWAHLTVHGVLHLLGHDHLDAVSAAAMESLEKDILAGLGIADPYESR